MPQNNLKKITLPKNLSLKELRIYKLKVAMFDLNHWCFFFHDSGGNYRDNAAHDSSANSTIKH